MAYLPLMLMLLIRQFMTLKSGGWAQLKLQNRYFIFLVVYVVFITTIGVSIQRTIGEIIAHPGNIIPLLAASLPSASHFYLNYVLIGWFTVAVEMLRWWQCAVYLVYKHCFHLDEETARAMGEPEDQDGQGMGSRWAKVALIVVLAIVFSSIMPLITFFALVFFLLCNTFFGYLLVYAETKKPDMGGAFWIVSLKHTLFALVLYVALMVGMLSAQGKAAKYPSALASSMFVVLFFAWQRLGQYNWEILPFENIAEWDHGETKRKSIFGANAMQKGEYIQPECRAPQKQNEIAGLHPDLVAASGAKTML